MFIEINSVCVYENVLDLVEKIVSIGCKSGIRLVIKIKNNLQC
jgi:hypothetical protein